MNDTSRPGNIRAARYSHYFDYIIAAGLVVFWVIFLCKRAAGFDFIDDKGVFEVQDNFASLHSVYRLAAGYIQQDLQIRFRPLYDVYYLTEALTFGSHFLLWSIWNAVIAAATSFVLFLFCRNLGYPAAACVLLPLLTLLGPQIQAYWLRVCQEAFGMLLTAVSLLAMERSCCAPRRRWLYGGLFVLFTICVSLVKESFILLIPALVFWKIWLLHDRDHVSWKAAIRANLVPGIILFIAMTAELFAIMHLGLNSNPDTYFGVQARELLTKLLLSVWQFWKVSDICIAALLVLAFLVWRFGCRFWNLPRIHTKDFLPLVILIVLWLGPQTLLYAKQGITGLWRYLLPGVFAIQFGFIWCYGYARLKSPAFGRVVLVILVVAVAWDFVMATTLLCHVESQRGSVQKYLKTIADSTTSDSTILVVADPFYNYEYTEAVHKYITHAIGRDPKNLYLFQTQIAPYDTEFKRRLSQNDRPKFWFHGNLYDTIPRDRQIDCVVIPAETEKSFLAHGGSRIIGSGYSREDIDHRWIVYRIHRQGA